MTTLPNTNLRGLPALPSVNITNMDLRGLTLSAADTALRKTLTKLGVRTPAKDNLGPGVTLSPEVEGRLPSEYLLKSFTQYDETTWLGTYSHLVVEPHPDLGDHLVRRHRHKVFYSATLEGVVSAISEYAHQLQAA